MLQKSDGNPRKVGSPVRQSWGPLHSARGKTATMYPLTVMIGKGDGVRCSKEDCCRLKSVLGNGWRCELIWEA
jgi:hypothetical protein